MTINAVMPKNNRITAIHMASILGNLIDNAIEACRKEDSPVIEISISTVKDFLIIKITNTCTAKDLPTKTTKRDSSMHGIGLKSVRNITDEYGGEFTLKLENSFAVATVAIPEKQPK